MTSTGGIGAAHVYSLVSGGDSAKFTIDASTGVLRFIASPDFENPTDVGLDNVYDVIVMVSDGNGTDQQAIAVKITDIANSNNVTTLSDVLDGDVSSIEALNANQGADGEISLREAILAANNTAGANTIRFDIAGRGIRTIYLTAALPTITDAIVLDATTQAGYMGSPILELDGRSAGFGADGLGADGLTLGSGSSGSTIRGFVINRFSGDGIQIDSDNNTIAGNLIGLRPETGLADQTIERTDLHTWLRSDGGTIVDSVDGHVFINSGVTLTSGRVGQGMTFDGSSGLTAMNPDEFNLDQFTYGFWFNRSSPLRYENLIGRSFGDGLGWTVHLDPDGYLKLRVDTGTSINQSMYSSVNGLADGDWHFGAVTMDLATRQMIITVDGGSASSGHYTGDFSTLTGGSLAIGGEIVGAHNYLGQLDEVQIFDRVLTSDEINDLYHTYSGTANILGNAGAGVLINTGTGNVIGGTTTADRNVIGNNTGAGVSIASGAGSGTQVLGNFIGTDVSGVLNFGNSGSGIAISAGSNHLIGGTTAGTANRIAFNGADGVSINAGAGSGSIVLGNTIYGNGDLGIDLGNDGVTANDTGDGDTGANDLQNFPVLTLANSVGGNITLEGTLNSQANTTYRVEFYSNPAGSQDPTNHGEGRLYLGWTEVTTDASGNAAISTVLNGVTVAVGDSVTATATRKIDNSSYGSTSEFGLNVIAISNSAPMSKFDTAIAFASDGTSSGTNPTGNVLTNDTDADSSDTKIVTGVAAGTLGSVTGSVGATVSGSYGTINIAGNGDFVYKVDNSNPIVQALHPGGNTITDVFTYTMQDNSGFMSTTQITVIIYAANNAPFDLSTTGLTVSENASNNTGVGTITCNDIDVGDTPSYSLVDSAGGRFAINPSTGVVTVADSSRLNYELATSHSITVRVTDRAGATYDEVFVVALTDFDEFDTSRITDTDTAVNSVAENATIGTVVGITVSATDADATLNRVVYSLDDNAEGRFAIDRNTGVVTVADSSGLNYEAHTSHSIIVRASSDDGSWSIMTFEIAVLNVEERPIGLSDHYSTSYIDVLRAYGSGVFSNDFDPDGDILSFQILSGPSSGVLTFTSDGKFDYTPHVGFIGQVTFTYIAFDGVLESDPIVVTLNVVLPANVANLGKGNGDSSGNGDPSGNGGKSSPVPSTPGGKITENGLPLSISAFEPNRVLGSKTNRNSESGEVGRLDLRDGLRIGDYRSALSERVMRMYMDPWTSNRSYDDMESARKHEEIDPSEWIWAIDSQFLVNASDSARVSLNLEQVVTTVIASGVILFALQASQLVATFITAAPSWIHVDIASTLDSLPKEKNADDEASAKIFE